MASDFLTVFNRTRAVTLANRVRKADDFRARSKGLLGRSSLAPEEGLWIVPCSMVHTFFMAFAIDVIFLDKGLRVARVVEFLKPWKISPWVMGAHSALELSAGASSGSVQEGDCLEFAQEP